MTQAVQQPRRGRRVARKTQRPRRLDILECTLRDGSYSIGYQFTAEDTAVLAAGLEEAGFRKIEVGHGLGLGASRPEWGVAAATDEDYLEAAASALTRAKFGAFCIPGIGSSRDVALAGKYGMGFLRIGTNVNETERAEPFIKQAKSLGMEVSCNLMKTYAIAFDEVLRRSERLVGWGADVICIVDSAGGMLPSDVATMVRRLRGAVGAGVGFHGHNNVQLAIANTLAAVDAGADVVDTCLRGMGRSAGNAQTEVIVMLLRRRGIDLGIDPYRTMELGDRLAASTVQTLGVDPIELTSGIALFHSSFLELILRVAERLDVDPRKLIEAVSEVNKIEVTEELALAVGRRLQATRRDAHRRWRSTLNWRPRELGGTTLTQRARAIVAEMKSVAMKTGKRTMFTIAPSLGPPGSPTTFPFIRSNSVGVIGNADVSTVEDAVKVGRAIDGSVDCILVGIDRPWPNGADAFGAVREAVDRSEVLPYRDTGALIQAVDALVGRLHSGRGSVAGVVGSGSLGVSLALSLASQGWTVRLWDQEEEARTVHEQARALDVVLARQRVGRVEAVSSIEALVEGAAVLMGSTPGDPKVTREVVAGLPQDAVVVGVGSGSLSEDAVSEATRRGLRVLRLDMRAGLSGQVVTVLESEDLFKKVMGRGTLGGVPVVAGGEMGERGTVVVDSITDPARVLSVADGRGGLLDEPGAEAYKDQIEQVSQAILRRRIEGAR